MAKLKVMCARSMHVAVGELGQAFAKAVGDKKGMTRYGHSYVPLDEALSRAVIDLSGRPGLVFGCEFTRARIGAFDVDLVREFFQALSTHGGITLHVETPLSSM